MSDNSIDGSLIVMKDCSCENANTLDGDYINWLEEFTVRFPSFSIESFLFCPSSITEEDYLNVCKLELLFNRVYEYAESNYIHYNLSNCGATFYNIQNNGVGYEIGIEYSPDCNFYCKRLDEPLEGSIAYQDVIDNKKSSDATFWDIELDKLESFIERLNDENVPIDSIEKVMTKTIQKIKGMG